MKHELTGKSRADVELVRRGMADSREKAQALILAGQVRGASGRIDKPSAQVSADDSLSVDEPLPYVSRGGFKLAKALDAFGVDPSGVTAIDIGASTGGFTDVLLQRGAAHVYAVDVGYGQLDLRLRNDPRVRVMERTNARRLTPDMFNPPPTLCVMDVSFISIRLLLPVIYPIIGEHGGIVTLVKPQFEAGRGQVGKGGVVRDAAVRERVLLDIASFTASTGWSVRTADFSPIQGPAGNIEFLFNIRHGSTDFAETTALVQNAARRACEAFAG